MVQLGSRIRVRGARTHNLYNVDVDLPRGRLTVITGVSGSGKSSLAFDTIHAEGQRRYLETLRGQARALLDQLPRPDVDSIEGLPPTLAVSQATAAARPRSTLATITEIHDHLRLLFARLGTPHCPVCRIPVRKHTVADIVREILALPEGRKVYLLAPLVQDQTDGHKEAFQYILREGFLRARVDGVLQEIRDVPSLDPKAAHTIEVVVDRLVVRPTMEQRLTESLQGALKHGQGRVIISDLDEGDWRDQAYTTVFACPRCRTPLPDLEPRRFSFNNPYGACPRCTGFGQVWELDPALLIPDPSWTLAQLRERLAEHLPEGFEPVSLKGWRWDVKQPFSLWPVEAMTKLLHGAAPEIPGLIPELRAIMTDEEDQGAAAGLQAFAGFVLCPECGGARLTAFARSVAFAGKSLPALTALTVDEAACWFGELRKERNEQNERSSGGVALAQKLLPEIAQRLEFLKEVGLGYLTLDRPALTLSGGELQRARLATHLGGGLLGVCFILDEPTLGLHPADTDRLLSALRRLQERGNTLIVVEHDKAVMRQADWLIDLGPGAGPQGGRLLAQGTVEDVVKNPASVTAPFLAYPSRDREGAGHGETQLPDGRGSDSVTIRGARHHNLKNIDVMIPLGRLVCLTGVSGSGKSSLGRDILVRATRRHLGLLTPLPGAHDAIVGLERLDKIIEADQTPLGRSSRSTPASYTGMLDELRKVFAATRLAKIRGYKANRFTFNAKGGRCEECKGQGFLRTAGKFLSDLTVPCPACRGARFNAATLEVRYRERNIADVLAMTVRQALEFFANLPALVKSLRALADIGLGYLALGQPSGTLSGGEAQRVKLAAELAKPTTGRTLIFLDEPTTGLHFADVANLLKVLRQLVHAGNTVVVIEHHLDVIAAADWVIDLGPGAGEEGGQLVLQGTPAEVVSQPASVTGQFLKARS